MSAGGASGAAAAAAAEAARQRREEEEEMTQYNSSDLAEGWEFKIIRSSTGAFKDPEMLRSFLEEEKKAGWSMLEKFDNGRIRLRRPASAAAMDGKLEFDPYRTNVGMSEAALGLTIAGVIIVVLLLLFLFIALVLRH